MNTIHLTLLFAGLCALFQCVLTGLVIALLEHNGVAAIWLWALGISLLLGRALRAVEPSRRDGVDALSAEHWGRVVPSTSPRKFRHIKAPPFRAKRRCKCSQ
jgi:hypothetical protein